MSKLMLKRLTIEAFSSFTNETTIDFNGPGLVLFAGRNGSGKSSLTEAVAYPLGYNQYPSTELQNWFTKKPLSVTEIFDSELGEISLTKSKKTILTINGEQVKGSVAQIEEKVLEITGTTPDILSLLCYRAQKQPGLLLSLTDADKKEFLTKILPLLGKFEVAIEASKKKQAELEAMVEAKLSQVNSYSTMVGTRPASTDVIENRIKVNKALLANLELKQKEIVDNIKLLEVAYKEARLTVINRHDGDTLELRAQASLLKHAPSLSYDTTALTQAEVNFDECSKRLLELELNDKKVLDTLNTQIKVLDAQKAENSLLINSIPNLTRSLADINNSLKELNDQKCPMCLRDWDDVQAKLQEFKDQASAVGAQIDIAEAAKLVVTQINDKIDLLSVFTPNPEIKEFEYIKETLAKQYNDEVRKIDVLLATHQSEHENKYQAAMNKVTEANNVNLQELSKLQEAHGKVVDQNRTVLKSIEEEMQIKEVITQDTIELNRLNAQIEQFDKNIAILNNANKELKELRGSLATEQEFSRAIGREGFLGSIFEEILDQIADEATKTLGSVANTSHCSIRFKTEVETQKGSIKKKITPIVSVGGNESAVVISKGRPRCAGVSGGMMATIELAVDLALGHVIAQRAGIMPGWLVLDEVFEGLDISSKESCMDILQRYAQTRLVIVIDHTSEFVSLFNKVFTLEQKNGTSYLT